MTDKNMYAVIYPIVFVDEITEGTNIRISKPKLETLYLLGDKVTYKPNHFQIMSGEDVVGSFSYDHKIIRVDALPQPTKTEGGE